MTYPPQQPYQHEPYQPPVVPGVPQSPAGWMPPSPPPPAKSRAVPLLIGALVVAVLVIGALGLAFVARSGSHGSKTPSAPAPTTPTLTQAGAQRACRTAFGKEFEARQESVTKKDILVSTQGIDLAETYASGNGFVVNGTVRYTLTSFPLDPVQNTLDLTCTVTGTDEAPVTVIDNRN